MSAEKLSEWLLNILDALHPKETSRVAALLLSIDALKAQSMLKPCALGLSKSSWLF